MENKLKESENMYKVLFEHTDDAMFILDEDKLVDCNLAAVEMFGYKNKQELWNIHPSQISPQIQADGRSSFEKANEMISIAFAQGNHRFGWDHMRKNGEVFPVEVLLTATPFEERKIIHAVCRDITEHKLVEEALFKSETLLTKTGEISKIGGWELDIKTSNIKWTEETFRIHELSLGHEPSLEEAINFYHPDDRPKLETAIQKALEHGEPFDMEIRLITAKGKHLWTHAICKPITVDGKTVKLTGTFQDITERKEIESDLEQTVRSMKILSTCNETLVRVTSEAELTKEICNAIVSIGGYKLAWVGYIGKNENKTVCPVSQCGFDEGYLEQADIRWDDSSYGRGPAGQAIKTGSYVVSQDIQNDPAFEPWREAAIKHGYRSVIVLPLVGENEILGTLHIYNEQAFSFGQEEISLLQKMADDMAYGIVALRTRAAKNKYSNQLSESLIQTIEAFALTVEQRDPYTAGHMTRVAELAVAIAKKIELSDQQIQGIELGASIHDIGKIYIPAEILNRPGKLSAAEFEMIKTHSQVGYDIIKGINLHWPVANMILQHHEKLDGSGYPNGLKGDEIIFEAQILSVADVVEAISAHRPYRPALGIEKGIEIIQQGKGIHFNPEVVDACVEIIEKDGFKFTTTF
jgi:PAS domain S-box-containing protein